MNSNDKLRDESIAQSIWVARYGVGAARRMVDVLNESDAELQAKLMIALDDVDATNFSITRTSSLLKSVREISNASMSAFESALYKEARGFAGEMAGYQMDIFRSAIPGGVLDLHPLMGITEEQVYASAMAQPFQGKLLKGWVSGLGVDRITRIENAITQGFMTGQTITEIARNVRGRANNGRKDGALELSRSNAATLTKTAMGHVAAVARQKFASNNDDLIKGKQWLSTLDNKTSSQCRVRDHLRYTLDNKPVGHKIPYLGGPGKIHFNAIAKGCPVKTLSGYKPIEDIKVGDLVLTHTGSFEPVTQHLSKWVEGEEIVRVYTNSGGVVFMSDDHPVLTATGWKFARSLEVGDKVFQNVEHVTQVTNIVGSVAPETNDDPSHFHKALVSAITAAKLPAPEVYLNGDLEEWYREIQNVVIHSILVNPSAIIGESQLHHLFALGHVLGKLGLEGFSDFLSGFVRHYSSLHDYTEIREVSVGNVSAPNFVSDPILVNRIVFGHALRVSSHNFGGFLSKAEIMMILSGTPFNGSEGFAHDDLLSFASCFDAPPPCECGEAAVSESVPSLNGSEGHSILPMIGLDDIGIVSGFFHVLVDSISTVVYSGEVYDLSVGRSNSYVVNGVLVSNCRSGETYILKSAAELGIPVKDLTPSERASMDGVVAGDTTYSEWFNRQSVERQTQIVGPDRVRLMREGGMSQDEFYSDKGQWLTLAQLRERHPKAFDEAGF